MARDAPIRSGHRMELQTCGRALASLDSAPVRRAIREIAPAVFVIGVLLMAFGGLIPGCASLNRKAYQTTGTSVVTVEAAMRAWSDYVTQFHPGAATEQRVKNALEGYKVSALAVIDTAQAYSKAKAAGAGDSASVEFNSAVAAASAALNDLLNVIRASGAKGL